MMTDRPPASGEPTSHEHPAMLEGWSLTDRPVSGEPSTEAGRRLRDRFNDPFTRPTHAISVVPDILAIEAEARATPPSLAEDDLDEVLSLLGPDALRRLQRHGFTVARLTSKEERE